MNNAAEQQVVGAPGLAQTADQDISFLNFGGTFFGTAEYLIDGTWDTRADWGGVIYVPSVDDVQEMKVMTNAFTAQYGWSSGNVVNIVTKSGATVSTETLGSSTPTARFDARYYFNNGAQPSFNRNQFGGTIGGPIIKRQTLFLCLLRRRTAIHAFNQFYTLPTTAERARRFFGATGRARRGRTTSEGRSYSGEIYNPFSTRQVTCGGTDSVTGNP